MNLMFWKKKTPAETDADDTAPGVGVGVGAGAIAWVRARLAALTGYFNPPPPFQAEVPVPSAETGPSEGEGDVTPPGPDDEVQSGALARIKLRLVSLLRRPSSSAIPDDLPEDEDSPSSQARLIVAAVALLLLLLAAFGFAAWKIVQSSPDPEADITELTGRRHADDPPLPIVTPVITQDSDTAPTPEAAASAEADLLPETAQDDLPASSVVATPPPPPKTELELLRQRNEELQAQIDALKKSQQPSSAKIRLYPGERNQPVAGGTATVGSTDAKASAATLKEAIEAMNAGPAGYPQKPAK